MLLPISKFSELLKDPINPEEELIFDWDNGKLKDVKTKKKFFKCVNGKPILIDFSQSIIKEDWFQNTEENVSIIGKRTHFLRKIKNLITGSDRNTLKSINIFKKNLPKDPKILLIGSGSIGMGLNDLYNDININLIAFDIYPNDKIQFIADGHNIPLKDSSVDGVIIQAVLEHVLDPKIVATEIYRVLKKDGIVYAETPFLQESHEEPYDFTRFTELGHRWLFRNFEEVYRKVNGGPGLTLYWSIRSLLRSIIGNKFITNFISLPFILFSLIDYLIPEDRKIKGANGLIFIGKKTNKIINQNEIIKHYIGVK
jgi:SAM-dependent methyltransferase